MFIGQLSHTAESGQNECEICRKTFKSSYDLKKHVQYGPHSDKQFSCEEKNFQTHSQERIILQNMSKWFMKIYLCYLWRNIFCIQNKTSLSEMQREKKCCWKGWTEPCIWGWRKCCYPWRCKTKICKFIRRFCRQVYKFLKIEQMCEYLHCLYNGYESSRKNIKYRGRRFYRA